MSRFLAGSREGRPLPGWGMPGRGTGGSRGGNQKDSVNETGGRHGGKVEVYEPCSNINEGPEQPLRNFEKEGLVFQGGKTARQGKASEDNYTP